MARSRILKELLKLDFFPKHFTKNLCQFYFFAGNFSTEIDLETKPDQDSEHGNRNKRDIFGDIIRILANEVLGPRPAYGPRPVPPYRGPRVSQNLQKQQHFSEGSRTVYLKV